MTTTQQIRLNALLLEREALWVRIHACETAAARILGEPYPFERPPLPSDSRAKRKAPGPRAVAAREPLRRLEPGEAAYRVTYRQRGVETTEEHEAVEALRVLLAAQGGHLQVRRIAAIDEAGAERAVLFDAGAG